MADQKIVSQTFVHLYSLQLGEYQRELLTAVEQLRVADRSLQVAKGQQVKTELTLKAVEELKTSQGEQKVFRSVGRMFILSSQDEIATELKDNLKSINTECARFTELKKTYEAKRDHYVKTLNDMTAKN